MDAAPFATACHGGVCQTQCQRTSSNFDFKSIAEEGTSFIQRLRSPRDSHSQQVMSDAAYPDDKLTAIRAVVVNDSDGIRRVVLRTNLFRRESNVVNIGWHAAITIHLGERHCRCHRLAGAGKACENCCSAEKTDRCAHSVMLPSSMVARSAENQEPVIHVRRLLAGCGRSAAG